MNHSDYTELLLLEKEQLHSAYEQGDFTSVPNQKTKFFRNFIPWQLIRFVWINLRMMVMIFKSHP